MTILSKSTSRQPTRKERKISKTELAQQLDLHKNVLGRYGCDQVKPSINVAAKIAEAMGVRSTTCPVTSKPILMRKW